MSSDIYQWALARKSLRKVWSGLTHRELLIIVKMVAQANPQDWIVWYIKWPAWQELEEILPQMNLDSIESHPESLHVPVKDVE